MNNLFENWRKFLTESLFHDKLQVFNGEERDNSHVTAVYKGFADCTFAKYLKGKEGEHEKWDFERGSDKGKGRYDQEAWDSLKTDISSKGITNPILVVVEWNGDEIIGRVYEGNHRIRLGCQTKQKIPIEVRFFGKSEQYIESDDFDFDVYRLVKYGLS